MSDFRPKKFSPSYSDIAWWLIPLAVFVGLALLWFGNADESPGEPVVLAWPSPDTELVATGLSSSSAAATANEHASFIPPTGLLHQRVLENLRRFQTEFRQMAPGASVSAAPGSLNRDLVAKALKDLFASTGLTATANVAVNSPVPETALADILLYTRKENREIVHRLIAAIYPYLSGKILLVFDERFTLDRLHLVIQGTPRFNSDGSVAFTGRTAAPAQTDGVTPDLSQAQSVPLPELAWMEN
ncbi:MAG: hypothetical protein V2I26_11615 [Halieaceae bacterium]|jgi:hypothetical protein|nr:hypothetical protein [Halieaceae bacterium]